MCFIIQLKFAAAKVMLFLLIALHFGGKIILKLSFCDNSQVYALEMQ